MNDGDVTLRRRLLLLLAGFFSVATGAAVPVLPWTGHSGAAEALRTGTAAAVQASARESAGRAVVGERRPVAPGARPPVFWNGVVAAHWDRDPAADRAVPAYDHSVAVLADAFAAPSRRSRAVAANGRAAVLAGLAPSAVQVRGPPSPTGSEALLS